MKQVSERAIRYPLSVNRPAFLGAGWPRRFIFNFSRFIDRLAGFAVALTMLLVLANILMRTLFTRPILGTMEYVGFFTAVAVGFALAFCALGNGHIAVDILVDRLPPSARMFIDTLVYFFTAIFLGACGWGLVVLGAGSAAKGLVSPTTQTPIHPFIYLVALGFFVFALVQLVKLADGLGKGGRRHE